MAAEARRDKRQGQIRQRLHPSALSWMLMCFDNTPFSEQHWSEPETRTWNSLPSFCLAALSVRYTDWRQQRVYTSRRFRSRVQVQGDMTACTKVTAKTASADLAYGLQRSPLRSSTALHWRCEATVLIWTDICRDFMPFSTTSLDFRRTVCRSSKWQHGSFCIAFEINL